MRLLRLEDDGEFSLVEFVGKNIPPYTVLSHTWGAEDEEVTFKDLMEGTCKRKVGYSKIRFCGKQAADDGLQFFWVDTCCIDKSSSSELSEAINSMFRWYKDAARCYAYLADVPGSNAHPQAAIATKFARSRWFTRGWTLQELLAPANVHFFSNDWSNLGSKDTLADIISAITRIDLACLLGHKSMDQASIAKKMSWASRRVTTRLEDTAYCLLGVFGVNMPLLYGEGERAFIRLQEEIMRVSDDQSLFAWGEPKSTPTSSSEPHERTRTTTQLRGLFASSPTEFATCGNIIPDEVAEIEEPYTLTNKGVRLVLPIYKDDLIPYDDIAILACRPEDSLLHVFVMPLKALGGCQFARGCTKPYTISRDHVTVLANRVLYIKQTLGASVLPLMESILLPPGFWIRTFPSVSGACISNVQPAECWDPQNRIVRSPLSAADGANWQASLRVAIENEDRGHRTILIGYSNGYPFSRLLPDADNISKRQIGVALRTTRESSYPLGLKIVIAEQMFLAMGLPVRIVDIRLAPMHETDMVREVIDNKLFA
ncbi:HET-domain-containing protein [Zopfia rhizophila CBS 207.26]|uniref:HET-domain-containing protein n=1 Tax=Zopfia rhizophila CBS 207.26 TaxID=1314779 RepID=A0A6A6EXU6_9PEZI|nr:HET-domain-containing protein [Zopfia rhizophila CBS 207.26]